MKSPLLLVEIRNFRFLALRKGQNHTDSCVCCDLQSVNRLCSAKIRDPLSADIGIVNAFDEYRTRDSRVSKRVNNLTYEEYTLTCKLSRFKQHEVIVHTPHAFVDKNTISIERSEILRKRDNPKRCVHRFIKVNV